MNIELYDCTAREGSQAKGARLSVKNRVILAEMLDSLGMDYIELGWPVAADIMEAFKILEGKLKKSKLVAFGSTSMKENISEDANLNAVVNSRAGIACIFGKTWIPHISRQLKITPQKNLERIKESILFLRKNGLTVFYDAEHYFDGFQTDPAYAVSTLFTALGSGAERIILCDTNGGTLTTQAENIVRETIALLSQNGYSPEKISGLFGVHFHDDCGLALANTLACLPHVRQVQGTINGLGERIGNLNYSIFLPIIKIKMGYPASVDLLSLKSVQEKAYHLFGLQPYEKIPFVGRDAFSHKAGVHVDALGKDASYEHISPMSVGNERRLSFSTQGGRSSLLNVARMFGYEFSKDDSRVLENGQELYDELSILEDRGYRIESNAAEQALLIEKYFGEKEEFFSVLEWHATSSKMESTFNIKVSVGADVIEKDLTIQGGLIDAGFKALKAVLIKNFPSLEDLHVIDFHVDIAKSREESSSVRTQITFSGGEIFETVGVDNNLIGASLEALIKACTYFLLKGKREDIKNSVVEKEHV